VKPVKLSPSSSPRKLSDDAGRRPTRSRPLCTPWLVLAAGGDAGADDLRVERAGQPAVAGDQQQADALT
jgi:hypothetical protein